MAGRRKWSSGRVVERSSDTVSRSFTGALSHLIAGVLCLVWLLAACELTPSERFAPRLVLHGLVLARGAEVRANINRSYTIDEPFDTVFAGASGVIWRGSDTWPLVHSVRDVYATSGLSPRPGSGDEFGLRVAKAGFDTVYGHTVVPDSFRILFPRDGDTVTMSDSMVWTRSRGCAGYYMSFRSIDQGDTFYYSLAIPNDTSANNFDSLVFTFPQMVFLYQFETGKHTLRVYALDTSYFDWVRARGFGPGAGPDTASRLTGGLGVFGSAVAESVEVYVATDTRGYEAGGAAVRSRVRFHQPRVSRLSQATRRPQTAASLAPPAWR